MHVSPSTLSRVVRRLEDEVGATLFDRDNRSVTLTAEGRVFLTYAEQSLQSWASLQQAMQTPEVDARGSISLFCSVTAVHGVLSPVLAALRQQYPNIELQLHTGDQAEAVERVAEGQMDVAIAVRPPALSKRLNFDVLNYSPLQFIAPSIPCAVRAQVGGVGEVDLRQKPQGWWSAVSLILPGGDVVRVWQVARLQGCGGTPAR